MRRPGAASRTATSDVVFHPLTPDRWSDFERLFGPRGACGGCWCMHARRSSRDFAANKGDGNRRAFRRIVQAGPPPGILAYAGDRAVGWCAIAPRREFVRLATSRVLAPVDDQPVWSVPCFFVAREWRRRGLSARLLRAALSYARSRGARIVEGYPIEPYADNVPAPFAWVGLPATFRAAGFHEVARRSKARPIMRRTLQR